MVQQGGTGWYRVRVKLTLKVSVGLLLKMQLVYTDEGTHSTFNVVLSRPITSPMVMEAIGQQIMAVWSVSIYHYFPWFDTSDSARVNFSAYTG